jgi:tetratricopeptide (TPR) repeat protein
MGSLAMSDDPEALDEQFRLWLAACDDALAAGAEPATLPPLDVPGELRPRLERELAWCQLVRQAWPQIAAGDAPSTLPETPPAEETAALPLTRLGRFELRRELGRGSFGVVFLAHDPRLRRDLALKVPRVEAFISPELRARFQHEARAAASLDHPNVVPIYEAGEENSICYIAQAYCPGVTLSAWLKQRSAPVPFRLAARLAATLAEAVQHAHERGVLHRDLKPGNIMLENPADAPTVTGPIGDGLPFIPRVMDFGLAKLMDGDGAAPEQRAQTQTGAVLGTPQYMAPEQADGRSKVVGPAADVYALGAILYELLAARPPFQGDTAMDTLVQVRNSEPLSPARLRPGLPRDLDTICLKCLEKQPAARYASAADLAADLRRFLAGETIRARPASALERTARWVRRRPALAALAAVSVAAVATVLVVVLVANARLQQQRDLAEKRREEAERQRQKAVAFLRAARNAVDTRLTRFGYDDLAAAPHVQPVHRELLEDAVHFYEEFVRLEADDPELRCEVCRAWRRLGNLQRTLGDVKSGEQSDRQALALAQQLDAEFPGQPLIRSELADCHVSVALALVAVKQREGLESIRQAVELLNQLVADFPSEFGYRAALAAAHAASGRLRFEGGEFKAAEEDFRRSVGLLEQVVAEAPAGSEYERTLSLQCRNLAVFLARQKRLEEAAPLFRRDLEFWEKLAARPHAMPRSQARAADAAYHLGNLLTESGRPQEGEKLLLRAAERLQQLVEEFPRAPDYLTMVRSAQEKAARLLRKRKDFAGSVPLLEQAVVNVRALLKIFPNDGQELALLSSFTWLLADSRLELKQYPEAARLAEGLPGIRPQNWQECYQAARLLTRCIPLARADAQLAEPAREQRIEQYSLQAVAWMREAFRRGCTEYSFFRSDPGLDVLRSREDFKQLVSELAGK